MVTLVILDLQSMNATQCQSAISDAWIQTKEVMKPDHIYIGKEKTDLLEYHIIEVESDVKILTDGYELIASKILPKDVYKHLIGIDFAETLEIPVNKSRLDLYIK